MADITAYDRGEIVPATGAAVPKKYHDNGDGTYSEQTYSGGGTNPTGAATAANQTTGNTSLSAINSKLTGAPNSAVSQVTAGSASGALIAARATRRVFVVRNHDAANSAYVGKGTVTSANGFLLKAGESLSIESVEAWTCIRDTADVALGVIELWD